MQTVDLDQFENKSGWAVIHVNDNNMYQLKNANGNRRPGFFTTRIFAEKALHDYLTMMTEPERTKALREANNAARKVDRRAGPQKKVLTPGKERNKRGPKPKADFIPIDIEPTETGQKILDSLKEQEPKRPYPVEKIETTVMENMKG